MKFFELKEKAPFVIKCLKKSLGRFYSKYHKNFNYELIDGDWIADSSVIPEPLILKAGSTRFLFEGDTYESNGLNSRVDE